MCGTTATISVGFSRERFCEGAHICFVFRDEADRKAIVSKFVESGLLEGERVHYFADTAEPREVVDWLGTLGVDVLPALEHRDFSVADATGTYCPDGTFDPDRMCEKLKDSYATAKSEGYPMARATGEMSWALKGYPGSERLMEYEAAINTVVKTHPITAMCQYDANRFDGELVFKALQVHPYMVMNGQLVKNPYYVVSE
ncbi:MAG: MEDS domain-containing protein [Spirochaetota bacterium]